MVVSSVVSILAYSLIIFAVYKVFQIAGDVSEMKDLLQDIKRNTQEVVPPLPVHSQSPESLLRAVSAESYPEP
jgi:hypothetical protein